MPKRPCFFLNNGSISLEQLWQQKFASKHQQASNSSAPLPDIDEPKQQPQSNQATDSENRQPNTSSQAPPNQAQTQATPKPQQTQGNQQPVQSSPKSLWDKALADFKKQAPILLKKGLVGLVALSVLLLKALWKYFIELLRWLRDADIPYHVHNALRRFEWGKYFAGLFFAGILIVAGTGQQEESEPETADTMNVSQSDSESIVPAKYQISADMPFDTPPIESCNPLGFVTANSSLLVRNIDNFDEILVRLPLGHLVCETGERFRHTINKDGQDKEIVWTVIKFKNGISGAVADNFLVLPDPYRVTTQEINLRSSIETHNNDNVIAKLPEHSSLYVIRKKKIKGRSPWFLVVTHKERWVGWVNSKNITPLP